jgi:hypothetical protein
MIAFGTVRRRSVSPSRAASNDGGHRRTGANAANCNHNCNHAGAVTVGGPVGSSCD